MTNSVVIDNFICNRDSFEYCSLESAETKKKKK